MEDKRSLTHALRLDNREALLLTGVEHVESFDDKEIVLETCMGILILKGEDLAVKQLNLEDGKLDITGFFKSLAYVEENSLREMRTRSKNLLQRMFS